MACATIDDWDSKQIHQFHQVIHALGVPPHVVRDNERSLGLREELGRFLDRIGIRLERRRWTVALNGGYGDVFFQLGLLKIHIKGALNNGVSKNEIKEVLLQTAIYCGVPAALDSFRIAREVFKEAES